jgi:hypothetical protein
VSDLSSDTNPERHAANVLPIIRAARGAMSSRAIADALNAWGVPIPRGGRWTDSQQRARAGRKPVQSVSAGGFANLWKGLSSQLAFPRSRWAGPKILQVVAIDVLLRQQFR